MNTFSRSVLLTFFIIATSTFAAEPLLGPVVPSYGPVFAVPEGSFNLEPNRQYKIIMDVGKGPDDPAALNRGIESAARFLNMSARNGIRAENLELALVLHGSAASAALTDSAHTEKFEVNNGNRAMMEELGRAGVAIYLCGQTAAYRGYDPEQLLPQITMAVSAMTVHVRLQQEGYQAILF